MSKITKAIIPIAGLGTRFLPLSKVVSKELWPLIDKPVIHYIVEEAKASGILHIVFVIRPSHKEVFEYFRPSPSLEKMLGAKRKDRLLDELKRLKAFCEGIIFSFAVQKKPLGDGHAVLQAKRFIGKEPCGVFFSDDIVLSKTPCFLQLLQVFKTCEKPILALKKINPEKLSQYGVVQVERIATRLYKIKKIVEKPKPEDLTQLSDLAIVGKYIITPEVFDYLKNTKTYDGDIHLAEVFNSMLYDGKVIYGYEFEGEWLECGTKEDWLKANLKMALQHPEYGKWVREYIK